MTQTVAPVEAACMGKHGFAHPADAMNAAKRGRRGKGHAAHAYRCAHCGKWHIGQSVGRIRRGKR